MKPVLATENSATIVPCLRYRDAPAAIEWLCKAFGFEKQLVVPGDGGSIMHAQLTLGNGMIMLGSVNETEFGALMKQPDQIGGAETQSAYIIVAEVDAHYARAKPAGRRNRHRHQSRRLRRPRLHLPRSGRPHLELRVV